MTYLLKIVVLFLFLFPFTIFAARLSPSSPNPAVSVTELTFSASADAAADLVARHYPNESKNVHFTLIPQADSQDVFTITSNSSGLYIGGSSANIMTAGFAYYLNYIANVTLLTWSSITPPTLPSPLPTLDSTITVTSPYKWRYYYNICTLSYTMAWWDWPTWEREIDWMALRGVNMPLALTGQEAVWYDVYTNVGLNDTEITDFFSGPAFTAWQRMGNMQGWGGPMTKSWRNGQVELQKKILARMRALDMKPILPAFNGYVPMALATHYPQADIHRSAAWAPFPDKYSRDSLLNPADPLFNRIGTDFITRLTKLFGTDHLYNSDTYNENSPSSNNVTYLSNQSRNIYAAMTDSDPAAVWVMQGWVFISDPNFWQPAQIQAWLNVVPNDRMIILDLMSEISPVFSRTNNFYGKEFIWNMLHNFGGNNGMYGLIDVIARAPPTAKASVGASMVGIGSTPEGINNNEIMYELLYDMAFQTSPIDVYSWLTKYVIRRYNLPQDLTPYSLLFSTYNILASTVYNCTNGEWGVTKSYIELTPGLSMSRGGFMATAIWYDNKQLETVVENFIKLERVMETGGNSRRERYEYDIIDFTKQWLSNRLIIYHTNFTTAYNNKNITALQSLGNTILSLIMDFDRLLATNRHYLLGTWIESARSWGLSVEESDGLEFNARNQVTLWGPTGQIADYASKQWSGLVSNYYLPRWQLFVDSIVSAVQNGQQWNETDFSEKKRTRELLWQTELEKFPVEPEGNTLDMVKYVLNKYSGVTQDNFLQYGQTE